MLQVMVALELLVFWGLVRLVLVRGKKGNVNLNSPPDVRRECCSSVYHSIFLLVM